MKRCIVIGCDNAAVELKKVLLRELSESGYDYEDVGVNNSNDDTYYPIIASSVANLIIDSNYQKEGILICGTGIGMAMCANKFPGIYAAVCHDAFSTERARLSNNANILCMGARVVGQELAKKLLKEWLENEYVEGTGSQPKVNAIKEIEKKVFGKRSL